MDALRAWRDGYICRVSNSRSQANSERAGSVEAPRWSNQES